MTRIVDQIFADLNYGEKSKSVTCDDLVINAL